MKTKCFVIYHSNHRWDGVKMTSFQPFKTMQQKFLDKFVETPLTPEAELELARIMCRCWAYGYNNGNYRDFRQDFDLGKHLPESEKELKK